MPKATRKRRHRPATPPAAVVVAAVNNSNQPAEEASANGDHNGVDGPEEHSHRSAGQEELEEHNVTGVVHRNGSSQPANSKVPSPLSLWSHSASVVEGLRGLKHWVRRQLSDLDVNKSDVSLDRAILRPLLAVEQLTRHPAFWYAHLGAVVTGLGEGCSAAFEVTANWLHYGTVEAMNRQGGEMMPTRALEEYLRFLVAAVEMAEQRLAKGLREENDGGDSDSDGSDTNGNGSGLKLKVKRLRRGLPLQLKLTNLDWILGPENEHSSLTVSYLTESPVKAWAAASKRSKLSSASASDPHATRSATASHLVELVHFSAPTKTLPRYLQEFTPTEQLEELERENWRIVEQTAVLYRRNATLALSVAISLVENPAAEMGRLLNNDVLVPFLLRNLFTITKRAPRLVEAVATIPVDHLQTAILSVVALFRAFSELKRASGGGRSDGRNITAWQKPSWVNADLLNCLLRKLIKSGGSGGKTTAAATTFAIFDRKVIRSHVFALRRRLLLLLQCLAEAVSRQLGVTDEAYPRNSAFKVPPALNEEEEESEPMHPALSIGYFAYGTNDVMYQPYQWKVPIPLKAPPGPGAATQYYYTEILLLTSGSMNIGFYFDGDAAPIASATSTATNASASANPVTQRNTVMQNFEMRVLATGDKEASAATARAAAAAVFYSPTTGELLVNGFSLPTNITQAKQEQAKLSDHSPGKKSENLTSRHSTIIGVLLETGIPSFSSSSSSPATTSASSSSSTSASQSNTSPTVYLHSHHAAVTFFVNHLKVEVTSEEDLADAFENSKGQRGTIAMKKFLSKFSSNLAAYKRRNNGNCGAAVFTVALAGYQAILLHRSQSSWYFEKDSKVAYNVGVGGDISWQEFPLMTKHADIERWEMCHLLGFSVVAGMNRPQFERMFRSEKASYEIKKDIANGTYGLVFQCTQTPVRTRREPVSDDSHQVVVKVMELKDKFDLKSINRELAFIKAIEKEKSQLFVKCLDTFSFTPIYTCLVFETLDITLMEYYTNSPVSLLKIRSIFYQMLKALQVLKKIKFVHADIKPQNVMLRKPREEDTEVTIKLIDFGFSCCTSAAMRGKRMITFKGVEPFDLNKIDANLYTNGYPSPEWLLNMANQELSDLWSTAVTIAETVLCAPLYRHIYNFPRYSQLAAIWNFCRYTLPENAFFQRLNEDGRQFFTREALRVDLSPPILQSPPTNGRPWRIKKLWEMTSAYPITETDKRTFIREGKDWSSWAVNTVEEIKPKRGELSIANQDLLKKLQDLLKKIFIIDPAKRITVNEALRHSLFRA